jgi:ATP/maltotriose-dependent transcriptional regulator MalT
MTQAFDLFGDPIPENWSGRGRPPHIPCQGNRNKVSMLLALGCSNERIARALRVAKGALQGFHAHGRMCSCVSR